MIQLLVAETNKYYNQCLDTSDSANECSYFLTSLYKIHLWLALYKWDMQEYYWSTSEQFCTQLYTNVMKHDWLFHVLRFLHFCENRVQPDNSNKNCDTLETAVFIWYAQQYLW
jgi:hypothetical protein